MSLRFCSELFGRDAALESVPFGVDLVARVRFLSSSGWPIQLLDLEALLGTPWVR